MNSKSPVKVPRKTVTFEGILNDIKNGLVVFSIVLSVTANIWFSLNLFSKH